MLEGTALDQDTFELKRPQSKNEWEGAYSPWHLSAWEYDPTDSGFSARQMFLHEISHSIEIYERCGPERLLLKNYGLEFGKFNRRCFDIEVWVLSLQDFLEQEIFGQGLSHVVIETVRKSFAKQIDVPLDEFLTQLGALGDFHRARGLAHYISQWQKICVYVKDNRGEKEPSMLEMLGFTFG